MQPNLFPPSGAAIQGMGHMAGLVSQLSGQVSALAEVEVDNGMEIHRGASGVRISSPHPERLQCFQITSCWKKTNPPPRSGASRGLFWQYDAKPVAYWWGESEASSSSECSHEGDELVTGNAAGCYCNAPDAEESSSSAPSSTSAEDSYWAKDRSETQRIFWGIASPSDENKWQKVLYP